VSKADLLPQYALSPEEAGDESIDTYRVQGPSGALRCSIETEEGLDQVSLKPFVWFVIRLVVEVTRAAERGPNGGAYRA
jgi:hypothetical protein